MSTALTTILSGSLALTAALGSAHDVESQEITDCSPFATYDEAQIYYADHPEAAPYIDPNYDGRACEVWFGVDGGVPPDTGQASASGDTSTGGEGIIYTGSGGLDGIDYDCGDFASQADAQAYFEGDGGSAANNVDGLDANQNGVACEDF
jgi:hypothetical protein